MVVGEQGRQLVLLVGGRGERLSPLSDVIPKPLMNIQGRPFIERVISRYGEQGFRKILLLSGYRSDLFENWAQTTDFGPNLEITFSVQGEELSPKERVLAAASLFSESICIAYGDNYIQMSLEESDAHYASPETSQIRVAGFIGEGYGSKSNIHVGENGVVKYGRHKAEENDSARYLNLGAFVGETNEILSRLSNEGSLEECIFNEVPNQTLITEVREKYYSLTDASRLAAIGRFFDPFRRTILLDRDGTLNEKAGPAQYVSDYSQFRWKEGSREIFSISRPFSLEFLVITNQPGVGKGLISRAEMDSLHSNMVADIHGSGGSIGGVFCCYHDWHDGCRCRKPDVGLFLQAQQIFDLNWRKCLYVGDDDRDEVCASRLGIEFSRVPSEGGSALNQVLSWLDLELLTLEKGL